MAVSLVQREEVHATCEGDVQNDVVCCRWEYDGTEEEAVKNIPYQLQRLFLQLQVSAVSLNVEQRRNMLINLM